MDGTRQARLEKQRQRMRQHRARLRQDPALHLAVLVGQLVVRVQGLAQANLASRLDAVDASHFREAVQLLALDAEACLHHLGLKPSRRSRPFTPRRIPSPT